MSAVRIGYYLKPGGYTVEVLDDDNQPIDEYSAGNHPGDSQAILDDDHPHRLSDEKLLEYALRTARDKAEEYGLPESAVFHDADAQKSIFEDFAALRKKSGMEP